MRKRQGFTAVEVLVAVVLLVVGVVVVVLFTDGNQTPSSPAEETSTTARITISDETLATLNSRGVHEFFPVNINNKPIITIFPEEAYKALPLKLREYTYEGLDTVAHVENGYQVRYGDLLWDELSELTSITYLKFSSEQDTMKAQEITDYILNNGLPSEYEPLTLNIPNVVVWAAYTSERGAQSDVRILFPDAYLMIRILLGEGQRKEEVVGVVTEYINFLNSNNSHERVTSFEVLTDLGEYERLSNEQSRIAEEARKKLLE